MPRPPSFDPSPLRLELQSSGPASAPSLADGLGVDRVTVQRALGRLGPDIVRLGETRAFPTASARRRRARGVANPAGAFRLSGTFPGPVFSLKKRPGWPMYQGLAMPFLSCPYPGPLPCLVVWQVAVGERDGLF